MVYIYLVRAFDFSSYWSKELVKTTHKPAPQQLFIEGDKYIFASLESKSVFSEAV